MATLSVYETAAIYEAECLVRNYGADLFAVELYFERPEPVSLMDVDTLSTSLNSWLEAVKRAQKRCGCSDPRFRADIRVDPCGNARGFTVLVPKGGFCGEALELAWKYGSAIIDNSPNVRDLLLAEYHERKGLTCPYTGASCAYSGDS